MNNHIFILTEALYKEEKYTYYHPTKIKFEENGKG